MKRTTFALALAAVAISNGFALLHVWLNRTGTPAASLTLRDSRATPPRGQQTDLDFRLPWHVQHGPWLSLDTLRQLGFDCSVGLTDPRADVFYRRQPPRKVFVAGELQNEKAGALLPTSELMLFDAALDADALRGRYPDASKTVVLPAVLNLRLVTAHEGELQPQLTADVNGLSTQIHIPKPFSDQIRANHFAPHLLHLNFGRFHEPWVTGVDFPGHP